MVAKLVPAYELKMKQKSSQTVKSRSDLKQIPKLNQLVTSKFDLKPTFTPRKNVKQVIKNCEENIILPPPQFRDRPIPAPRIKKQILQRPIPIPRKKYLS